MSIPLPTALRLSAAAGFILALAACAGAPTRIHTLAASAPSAPAGGYAAPLFRVDVVHVPPALDRPELVRRTERYAVTLSDNDRWAAPLSDLMRRALTEDLALRLPTGAVVFPDAPKPPTAAGLVVDILALSPSERGVEMDASWTWVAPRASTGVTPPTAGPIVAAAHIVHLTAATTGQGVEAVAPEISALLGQLADRIAADPRNGPR